MKFQHLILPLILWLFVGICITFFVPTSPFIIAGAIVFIFFASYFSLRVVSHNKIPLIVSCCISLFLLSSMLSGFNLMNLLLIAAIGTLISLLTTSH